jgi:cephalosporin-C deacetylase-like acetyl esterase
MTRHGLLWLLLAVCLAGPATSAAFAQDELKVFRTDAPFEAEMISRQLYDHLTAQAWKYLDEHDREIAAIRTPDDIAARQRLVRERILSTIGPLPQRTELKAQVTGTLTRGDYRVEKILFQSQPGFYVTALLYVPTRGKGPFPAVLGTCGHTDNGKAADVYQRLWISLALKGCVVLAFDPPGQGERFMYWSEDLGQSVLPGTVIEHTMAGVQCLLTGSNVAAYFIWDGMRGVDYLLSRPEVDPKRIAVTGNSGGGMQSAYLGALEERLAAVVPSCYLTSWRRLWETLGPQDAEQNMIPFVASRLDFVDYIIAAAPRPYLMNLALQDFFNIVGARATFEEARRIYGILGEQDKLAKFEADDRHGYTLPRREACYGWLGKQFLGQAGGPEKEPDFVLEPESNLQVTPTGQVSTSYPGAETVGSLNAEYAGKIMYRVPEMEKITDFESFRENLLSRVRQRIGFERLNTPLNIQHRGSVRRPGMTVELLTFDPEPGITLPALLFRPDSAHFGLLPRVLYAADTDKGADAGGDIAALVAAGHVVLASDVRGKGETARRIEARRDFADWFSADWQIALMALQVNKPLVGMRTLDLVRAVDVLSALEKRPSAGIVAVGKGSAGVYLLHAAALDNRITRVVVEGGLLSWNALVRARFHRLQLDNVVHGALADYDLPALAASIAPRTLILGNLTDPMGHPLPIKKVSAEYKAALRCYELMGRQDELLIVERQAGLPITTAYRQVFQP